MSDPRYEDIGAPDVRLIEECAELIKALSKARRFGWDRYDPVRPWESNQAAVEREMEDVERRICTLRDELAKADEKERRAW